ncbi:MAG: SIR2 family protein [Pseudorhizobium pelagicum]|uniref:SIR2 family protein n=1 Tax=Pseudorhizobium pelagicum TaxID=1509405 RepID=UPI0034611EF6
MDPILSLAHSIQTSPGVYAVLLGSGISRSAGIPTGWEVTLDLVGRIATLSGEDTRGDPARWYQDKFGREPGYSELLDVLAKTPAERRAILHEFFEPTDEEREDRIKMPTAAHRAVAELVRDGFIKVIVTTNFDRLMEVALTDVGVVPTVISTADATQGAAPLVHQKCVIVKIHGDYLDDRIKNTEDELASYDPAMDAYLDRILDEFGLIVCGWSGEWDQALRAAFERCSSRRYATFWAARGKLGARAEKLLTLRGGHLIEIDGADRYFVQLQEMVEGLKESKAAHPLSVSAQVSAVKKFVATPEYRVKFHDLLVDEASRVRAFLESAYTMEARPVDTTTIKARFEAYDASTAGLQHMLFAAAQWAEPYNFASIRQSIAKLVPSNQRNGVVTWLEMNKYPGAVCFYAASYGAMAGGNWSLFKYLVEGRLTHSGNEENLLEHLGAVALVNSDAANALHPQKRYTPISDHFLGVFGKLSKAEYIERDFERLEVLLALHYLKASASGGRHTLRGRFVWNHSGQSIQNVRQEIEREGEEWPPFKAGLFGGTKETAVSLIENLLDNVIKMANRYW